MALAVPGGSIQVLSLPDLLPVYLHQHATVTPLPPLTGGEGDLWASDVKFSPDGTTLALVCDGAVALYTLTPSALTATVAAGEGGGEGEAPPPAVEGEEGTEGGAAAAPVQFLSPKEGFTVSKFAPHTMDFSADALYLRLTDAARGVLSVRQLFYTAPPPVEPVDPPAPAAEVTHTHTQPSHTHTHTHTPSHNLTPYRIPLSDKLFLILNPLISSFSYGDPLGDPPHTHVLYMTLEPIAPSSSIFPTTLVHVFFIPCTL